MKADGHAFWLLSQEKHWRTLRSPGSDFWIGFQESWVTADAPDSPLHYIGTPAGVVDLRDGQSLNHSPSYGVRGLTGGSYRPEELQQLEEAFARRFTGVLSYENGQAFLDLLGLALTRTAPNRRGWVAVLARIHRWTGMDGVRTLEVGRGSNRRGWSGEPAGTQTAVQRLGVYPRACGGTDNPLLWRHQITGLSPRLRGNQLPASH